jgi:hypothetical protein
MLQWGEVELVGYTTTQVAMAELGQTRTLRLAQAMSGLPPEADILAIPALFS